MDLPSSKTCTEFLTPKMQRDKIRSDIATLNAHIKAEKQNKQFEAEKKRQQYERKINDLNRAIEEKRATNRILIENIEKETMLIHQNYMEKKQDMMDTHIQNLEDRARLQAEKEEADN